MDDLTINTIENEKVITTLYSLTDIRKSLFGKFYLPNFKLAGYFITVPNLISSLSITDFFTDEHNVFINEDSFMNLTALLNNQYQVDIHISNYKKHSSLNKHYCSLNAPFAVKELADFFIESTLNHTASLFAKPTEKPQTEFTKLNKLLSFDFSYDNDYNLVDVGISSCFNKKQIHKHYIVKENFTKTLSKNSKYYSFNFGTTKVRDFKNIQKIVNDMVISSDCLILHDSSNDMRVLEKINVDPSLYESKIIDTSLIFTDKHSSSERTSLKDLLIKSGILYKRLHNSGNDAAYTLQAFIKNIKAA